MKLWIFVHYQIQPLANKVKSYIQDSTDFINKIQQLGPLPKTVLLAVMDVAATLMKLNFKL